VVEQFNGKVISLTHQLVSSSACQLVNSSAH
jgi:hypothetical protein